MIVFSIKTAKKWHFLTSCVIGFVLWQKAWSPSIPETDTTHETLEL